MCTGRAHLILARSAPAPTKGSVAQLQKGAWQHAVAEECLADFAQAGARGSGLALNLERGAGASVVKEWERGREGY